MLIWDVLSRRGSQEKWQPVGAVNAPDLEMAMLLTRETHFRHGEALDYAVRRRGEEEIHECPDPTGIGGIIDRAYRRSEGYVGVGAKLKRVHREMASRGLVIGGARPGPRRTEEEVAHG
jgi:1,2-phenylacetyl-CoA epoxidase PaaB subunit